MEIFKLVGRIMVDSTEAETSISKTGKEADGLGTKLKSGLATAAKWGTALVGAATAVGGAMIAMAKDSADALGDIDDAAQRIGVDAETMQELQYVAEMSGMAMTDLEKAAKKLEGTDMNLDDAINEIMSLGSAEEQTQKAIEIFGESVAYKMQPLLNQGADGIEAFKEQAHDLGIVLSNETVEAGASFGDMFDAVTKSVGSMKNQLAADLMPYISEILQWVLDNLPMIQETIKSVVEAIWPIVKNVLDLIMKALPPILNAVKALIDWLMPYLQPVLEAMGKYIEGLFKLFKGDFAGFATAVKDLLKSLAKALYGIGKDIMNGLWDGIKAIWTNISSWFTEKVSWIKDKLNIWKDTQLAMNTSTDGSHASGLSYVPYDGYTATLHRGESVMTSQNTQDLMNTLTNAINSKQSNQPIELTVTLDSAVIAKQIYNANKKEALRRGTSLVGA